ncbi:DUF2203 domain-containing protein [Streptomonospora nanhaiensis]|uniref:DUF2203 domain-containing protein n=1 Tax=Streptomonospora nanhaiensis TaxID=1323731 RepID=A0A853BUL3_9ACTN|nr:DUF2203 domain-containing protein [Streptomonospora nanhaiensis]MBV2363630.1 DUF2203 domain-containing protein [Streptomonospora nanhaiensis]MBX9391086.1 DUF2203 domain-containing protein [Streptomonospora nanhaiensis]NYI98674.1 hypothetical protein [Streptomonospora nanhaiensis]
MDDAAPPPADPFADGYPEPRVFTPAQARDLMPEVHRHAAELVTLRADLAEMAADLGSAGGSALGGRAELKAAEARIGELRNWFLDQGIELKGVAPLLIDFPALLDGVSVRLCWLEGESELAWYHRTDLGFVGRRPLPRDTFPF